MSDRERTVKLLGEMMDQAARASVARGAQYAPGEVISTDSAAAWRGIAEALVATVEKMVTTRLEGPK